MRYGLNLWAEAKTNGGFPRWTFNSEEEVQGARVFAGKSLRERIKDV